MKTHDDMVAVTIVREPKDWARAQTDGLALVAELARQTALLAAGASDVPVAARCYEIEDAARGLRDVLLGADTVNTRDVRENWSERDRRKQEAEPVDA